MPNDNRRNPNDPQKKPQPGGPQDREKLGQQGGGQRVPPGKKPDLDEKKSMAEVDEENLEDDDIDDNERITQRNPRQRGGSEPSKP